MSVSKCVCICVFTYCENYELLLISVDKQCHLCDYMTLKREKCSQTTDTITSQLNTSHHTLLNYNKKKTYKSKTNTYTHTKLHLFLNRENTTTTISPGRRVLFKAFSVKYFIIVVIAFLVLFSFLLLLLLLFIFFILFSLHLSSCFVLIFCLF